MTTFTLLPFKWQPLPGAMNDQLLELLQGWEGTKYMAGAQGKQMGVDCVRFVAAILDSITGQTTPIVSLPQDASFHNKTLAQASARQLLRLYEPFETVEKGSALQPADVIVVGCTNGGPGHAIMVGPEKHTLWQSDCGPGVAKGGFSLVTTYQKLFRVYRLINLEERWSL